MGPFTVGLFHEDQSSKVTINSSPWTFFGCCIILLCNSIIVQWKLNNSADGNVLKHRILHVAVTINLLTLIDAQFVLLDGKKQTIKNKISNLRSGEGNFPWVNG